MAKQQKNNLLDYKSPFSTILRSLMTENNTTQDALAAVTRKTRQTISQYVNGISEPGYDTLIKIADYYNVSVDYILGRTQDRRVQPSIYDQVGLSEKNITLLRLAHRANTSADNMQELTHYICQEALKDYILIDKIHIDEETETYIKRRASVIASTLPSFIDTIIEMATATNLLLDSYSQIESTDYRNPGLSDLTYNEFVEYKIYQIANVITWELRRKFIEIDVL